ncbi:hypothetical protein EX30DRAFT_340122 [Ascodesmis nigricans]|uniref:Uncharacterized protein n=1 Tax=Ascodesmis nigricans TaxID=341454 RepID=A0A4S2MZJ8_9PEZI|nr:hypothetical protein EX30DRAFT_340122 [Ascodesmis nigricans]
MKFTLVCAVDRERFTRLGGNVAVYIKTPGDSSASLFFSFSTSRHNIPRQRFCTSSSPALNRPRFSRLTFGRVSRCLSPPPPPSDEQRTPWTHNSGHFTEYATPALRKRGLTTEADAGQHHIRWDRRVGPVGTFRCHLTWSWSVMTSWCQCTDNWKKNCRCGQYATDANPQQDDNLFSSAIRHWLGGGSMPCDTGPA